MSPADTDADSDTGTGTGTGTEQTEFACDRGEIGEARETAAILPSGIDELLTRYTAALQAHDIPVPFSIPRQTP
ncbi:DUF6959 family protein [Streptomyces scabiei]|uniref:DUF6959 family protein n=1 Tax=Streptomyces scabiei TaxID=1930 RepID=UPI003F4D14E5